MTRVEKFAVTLFSVFTALLVIPALAFSVVAIIAPGSIDLGN